MGPVVGYGRAVFRVGGPTHLAAFRAGVLSMGSPKVVGVHCMQTLVAKSVVCHLSCRMTFDTGSPGGGQHSVVSHDRD